MTKQWPIGKSISNPNLFNYYRDCKGGKSYDTHTNSYGLHVSENEHDRKSEFDKFFENYVLLSY